MAFGIRYFAELQSKFKGSLWRVEVAERGYAGGRSGDSDTSGSAAPEGEEMAFDGNEPLTITWEKRGDEFYAPVKASEASVNILCTENFKYIGLFTSDPRRFRVSVFRNAALYWRGYVVADLYSENFTAPPYRMSIKAVDGFNLLQSIPFANLDGTPLTGKRTLWQLLSDCIELLELELDVADWMDLYAEGMDEAISPMRQVYVDMERFYQVYNEPNYRDVLELCLRPFAGQIFQSNGSLHIRRTISLYRENRPLSFYEIGTKFPSGFLIAADGRELLTDTGTNIVTESARDRIESMWNGGFDVMGDSTMDIVPPLRKVTVSVKNKMSDDLIPLLGFYNPANWFDYLGFLSLTNAKTLRLSGGSANQGLQMFTLGYPVQQCTYTFKWEFLLRSRHWQYGGSRSSYSREYTLKARYGLRVSSGATTYYLLDNGSWSTNAEYFEDDVKTSAEVNKKIEIQGIPISGYLYFVIIQSAAASGDTRYGVEESIDFANMTLSIDTGDDYEKSLSYNVMLNHANNVDMAISLPIADVPNIPNQRLIYSLYFTDSAGKPTRMWHTRGGNDYNTLINHLVQCALRYKQLPSRRVSGDMFTGRHLDMNSVIQDSKYLRAGFYVNSIELKAVEDSYNTELVEMPGLIRTESPPPGDDCILLSRLDFTVKTAIMCGSILILLSTTNKIYAYDPAAQQLRLLLTYTKAVYIYPSDDTFAVVDGTGVSIIDYRGVTLKRYDKAGYNLPATYMGGYIYILVQGTTTDRNNGQTIYLNYYYLNRPGYTYVSSTTYRRGYGYSYTTFGGTLTGILKSDSAIVVNTSAGAWLHDKRTNTELTATAYPAGTEVKTVSDYFMAENLNGAFRIYRRDSFADRTLIKSITGKADYADHTLGEVAYASGGLLYIWTYLTNAVRQLRNTAGTLRPLQGLHYINGELHIVRENAIYKYIP